MSDNNRNLYALKVTFTYEDERHGEILEDLGTANYFTAQKALIEKYCEGPDWLAAKNGCERNWGLCYFNDYDDLRVRLIRGEDYLSGEDTCFTIIMVPLGFICLFDKFLWEDAIRDNEVYLVSERELLLGDYEDFTIKEKVIIVDKTKEIKDSDKHENMQNPNSGNKADESDVFDLVRSPEIRNFFREKYSESIYDKAAIIIQSLIPAQKKSLMLKELSMSEKGEDAKRINEIHVLYEKYLNEIYHPRKGTLFAMSTIGISFDDNNLRFIHNRDGQIFFDTIEEVLDYFKDYKIGGQLCGEVRVLQTSESGKHKEPFIFQLYWIDDRWQILDIYFGMVDFESPNEEKYFIFSDISKNTMQLFEDLQHKHLCENLSPLFDDKCRLKLQYPFMKEPFYCIMESYTYNGHVNYYLIKDNSEASGTDDSMFDTDIPKLDINWAGGGGYNLFDWLERNNDDIR